ncbi:HlyD family efflux transporter periplasmic adaptor subunit [Vibrio sp. S11_S32]|uniref:efflux RND transporter periplasmic adaptor subunit n=1 Tax=Vibrio sp. S11_S32 TaxID=2720225 RepID=UPI001680CEAE|nr:efflux RND transporter periplasmic adaptor subunit [Vibrio sp. S11_S32]MBD1576201.1 HlyD family efflux transporter periplasmic adaptor subunit [Vibrio sp. S11_S32]
MDTQNKNNSIAAKPRSKRKASFLILLLVIICFAVGGYFYYLTYLKFYQSTDDAYVNGNLVTLTPEIAGTVTTVMPDEGDFVKKGQVLVELDSNDTQIALQEAEAKLGSKVREVRSLYATADNFKAKVAASQVKYRQAVNDYNRRKHLVEKGAISKEDLNHYLDTVYATRSELKASQEALKMTLALVDNTVLKSHPGIKSAVANLRQSYLTNIRTKIVAPVSGYVAKRAVQLGSRVQPGTPLMVIVPLHQVWVDANFKESQMKDMRIGQPVTLTSDLYGEKVVYKGEVESLGIGTGSAFSLLPAQNASGNWIKIVQRLPVKIRLDDANQDKYPLRIGLSMLAEVSIKNTDGKLLSVEPKTTPSYSTDVYTDALSQVDSIVTKILHDNLGMPDVTLDAPTDVTPEKSEAASDKAMTSTQSAK